MADRWKSANFFIKAFGYKVQQEFTIQFDNGESAQCIALEPPEKKCPEVNWTTLDVHYQEVEATVKEVLQEYHLPPEIFISDGTPGSIVADWVAARNGIGGIHHIAYQVESVDVIMKQWKEAGYAEFTSNEPMRCEEQKLVQAFTKPSELTGVIYEFIERQGFGFCKENVKSLMESTKNL